MVSKDSVLDLKDRLYKYTGSDTLANGGKAILASGDLMYLDPGTEEDAGPKLVSSRGAVLDYGPTMFDHCKKALPEDATHGELYDALIKFGDQASFREAPAFRTDAKGNQVALFSGGSGWDVLTVTHSGSHFAIGQASDLDVKAMTKSGADDFNPAGKPVNTVSARDFQDLQLQNRSLAGRVASAVRKISKAPDPYVPSNPSGATRLAEHLGADNFKDVMNTSWELAKDEHKASEKTRPLAPGMVVRWWTRDPAHPAESKESHIAHDAVVLANEVKNDRYRDLRLAPIYDTGAFAPEDGRTVTAVPLPKLGPFTQDGPKEAIASEAFSINDVGLAAKNFLIHAGGPVDEAVVGRIQELDAGKRYPEKPRHSGAAARMKAMQEQDDGMKLPDQGGHGWDGSV